MNKKIMYFIGVDTKNISASPYFYDSIDKNVALEDLDSLKNLNLNHKLFLVEVTEVPTNASSE